MRAIAVFVAACAIGSAAEGRLSAQEKERVRCDPALPQNKCPGPDCACTEDTLEVTFDGDTASNSLLQPVGSVFEAVVMTQTVTPRVQAWVYGVSHDDAVLTLEAATIDDTDAKEAFRGGFNATRIDVESCENPADPKCTTSRPGGGWISAVVLALTEAAELGLKRNSLARARYEVRELPAEGITSLAFTDRLKVRGSPPIQISFTIDGKARAPRKLVDGQLVSGPAECPEHALFFGAGASNADFVMEEDRPLSISMRSTERISGFSLALKTPLAKGSPWEFANQALGQSAERVVPLELIDASGVSRVPAILNRALSGGQRPVRIERGGGTDAFEGRDLLVYDLTPAHGGPGIIAGYVADLGGVPEDRVVIEPASGVGCAAVEVLRVIPGDVDSKFTRGDADASGSITIVDAILAVPIGRRLPVGVDCDDAFDADDDGRQTILDVIVIIQFLFQNGADFPAPFAACGTDPTDDHLECSEFQCP